MSDVVTQFLAVCNAFVGFAEQEPNRGQVVDAFIRSCGLKPPQPWCAAFLSYCGERAFSVYGRSQWPVPMSAACKVIGEWAAKQRVLYKSGEPGDLVLFYYPKYKRFAHIGVLVAPVAGKKHTWVTIEGNTSGGGTREGYKVNRHLNRVIDPAQGHRFVRWRHLMQE